MSTATDVIRAISFAKLTHGNYHSWKLRASGRLKEHSIWRVVDGTDIKPDPPTPPEAGASIGERTAYEKAKKELRDWQTRDDKAAGLLIYMIQEDQERHIENYTSAKDLWDTLKKIHEEMHTGIAAFYTKIGILEKKYVEGESMQAHIDFLLRENKKLASSGKAFDDEFMAQVLLMSLPRPSTWETLAITLLQAASDSKKLATNDVSARLLQEASRLVGAPPGTFDSALHSRDQGRGLSKSSDKGKPDSCKFCRKFGHPRDKCCKQKRELEKHSKYDSDSQPSDDSSAESAPKYANIARTVSSTSRAAAKGSSPRMHVF